MSENQELLPCPFCGGKPEIGKWSDAFEPPHISWKVRCTKCFGTAGVLEEDQEDAVEAWNRRSHPDTLTDEAKLRRSQALDELGALDGEMLP